MAERGAASWISSLQAIRASHSASRASEQAQPTSDTSGQTWRASSANATQPSLFSKMSPTIFDWASTKSDESYSAWATTLRRACSQRQKSALPIDVSDCSSWPTVTVGDCRSSARHTTTTGVMHDGTTLTDAARMWPTPSVPNGGRTTNYTDRRANGTKNQKELGAVARMWPTPAVDSFRSRSGERKDEIGLSRMAKELWPTPDHYMRGGPVDPDERRTGGHQVNLQDVACHWLTPTKSDATAGAKSGGLKLKTQTSEWPTPAARDYKGANGPEHLENGTGRKHLDQLPNFVAHLWATPRAEDSESCGNHPGASDSLTGQCRSFHQDQETSTPGEISSPDGPTSPQLWRTPHGFANVDATGKRAGGGGEFHKQVMHTPMAQGKPTLNPLFVEWLMALPLGWTDCEHSAMVSSLWWPRMRFVLSRLT